VYAKENFQESHFHKKTFKSVNLLESLCKIVEFIFKIIVHISRSVVPVVGDAKRQPNFKWRRGGSAIGVTKIDYKQSQIVYFFFLSQGLRFPNFS